MVEDNTIVPVYGMKVVHIVEKDRRGGRLAYQPVAGGIVQTYDFSTFRRDPQGNRLPPNKFAQRIRQVQPKEIPPHVVLVWLISLFFLFGLDFDFDFGFWILFWFAVAALTHFMLFLMF